MNFTECLKMQIKLHPSMQPQDAVKMCFQAAFGAEHLLMNVRAAREYLLAEYASTAEDESALAEQISPDFCRVNLAACKREKLSPEHVFEMFRITASQGAAAGGGAAFAQCIKETEELAQRGETPFTSAELKEFLAVYDQAAPKPVHHSNVYREREHPAYRVVSIAVFNAQVK